MLKDLNFFSLIGKHNDDEVKAFRLVGMLLIIGIGGIEIAQFDNSWYSIYPNNNE